MADRGSRTWETLEQWSGTLFLLSAGLFFFNAIYELLQRFTPYLGDTGLQNFAIYLFGLVTAVIGLLGMYRRLANRAPRLARTSAGIVGFGTGSVLILLSWAVIVTLLNGPMPPGVLIPITVGLTLLGVLLFGITSLRTQLPSRAVGGLLLGFVLMWIVGIATMSPLISATEWLPVVLLAATGIFPLAIGYRLGTTRGQSRPSEPAADTTS